MWNWIIPAAASIIGGAISSNASRQNAQSNINQQREFAQQGIQWRVEDAKKAGVHPLFALGANLPQFSPVHAEDSMGPALAEAGQSIGRGLAARGTPQERLMFLAQLRAQEAQIGESEERRSLIRLERMKLMREMLGTPAAPDFSPGANNLLPEGQVPSERLTGMVEEVPSKVSSYSKEGNVQAGVPAGFRFYKMPGFDWSLLLPSQDLSEPMESAGEVVAPAVILAANISYLADKGVKVTSKKVAELKAAIARYHKTHPYKPLGSREGNLWRR